MSRKQKFDVGKSSTEKLRDKLSGRKLEKISEKHSEIEKLFKENSEREIPKHPYKVYRDFIDGNDDLSDEQKVVAEVLKEEYCKRWRAKAYGEGANPFDEDKPPWL